MYQAYQSIENMENFFRKIEEDASNALKIIVALEGQLKYEQDKF